MIKNILELFIRQPIKIKLFLWLPVRVSQISGPLEGYMVVNFRNREISQGVRKLTRTSTLIKKNIYK
jgi:hypothetical protein